MFKVTKLLIFAYFWAVPSFGAFPFSKHRAEDEKAAAVEKQRTLEDAKTKFPAAFKYYFGELATDMNALSAQWVSRPPLLDGLMPAALANLSGSEEWKSADELMSLYWDFYTGFKMTYPDLDVRLRTSAWGSDNEQKALALTEWKVRTALWMKEKINEKLQKKENLTPGQKKFLQALQQLNSYERVFDHFFTPERVQLLVEFNKKKREDLARELPFRTVIK